MTTGPECYEQNADNSLYIKEGKLLFNSTLTANVAPVAGYLAEVNGWWFGMSDNCCATTYFLPGDPFYVTDKWDCGWDYDEGVPECCP